MFGLLNCLYDRYPQCEVRCHILRQIENHFVFDGSDTQKKVGHTEESRERSLFKVSRSYLLIKKKVIDSRYVNSRCYERKEVRKCFI